MTSLGLVIIGRNEGEKLRKCLLSINPKKYLVVYVDSGSTDGSIELARSMGATAISLDASQPFTAARGRNAGFRRLIESAPETEFVQFIDGDCELFPGWLDNACVFLQSHPKHAIVCGRLHERYPEKSVYNSLCDFEWDGPTGDISACGGIFMIRTKAFLEVGGMNDAIRAGEEPEMCLRLRRKGWLIRRVPDSMAWHDADILRFTQWWKRVFRSGYGAIEVYTLSKGNVFSDQIKRTRIWTVGWLLALAIAAISTLSFHSTTIAWLFLFLACFYPMQIIRMAIRYHRSGLNPQHSFIFSTLMMVSKWAELAGHIRYLCDSKAQNRN